MPHRRRQENDPARVTACFWGGAGLLIVGLAVRPVWPLVGWAALAASAAGSAFAIAQAREIEVRREGSRR